MDRIISAIKKRDGPWLHALEDMKNGTKKTPWDWALLCCASHLPLSGDAQSKALSAACETDDPAIVQWVLDNTRFDNHTPVLGLNVAIASQSHRVNAPAVVAAIVGHDRFSGRGAIGNLPPDNWRAMCVLLCHGFEDNELVWNAVLANKSLDQCAHHYAKMVLKLG